MVRRKETGTSKPEPVAKTNMRTVKPVRAEQYIEDTEPVAPARKAATMRVRRPGGAMRLVAGLVIMAVLVGAGWFATQWMLGHKSNGVLAGLFNSGTKLTGESDHRVNILLIGNPGDPKHDGPDLTDTLMVASYDTDKKFLNLFSIPRDLYVAVPNQGSMKINAVYSTGKNKDGDGITPLTATVENLLGLKIPYYMRIDFQGFSDVINDLGGVNVTVTKDLSDPFYPADNNGLGYQLVEFKTGSYTMDGSNALKYVRSRETTSDFDRARRQQDVIMAVRSKAMDLEWLTAPNKVFQAIDALSGHFETNLSKAELTRLFSLMSDYDPTQVANKVFSDSPDGLLYGTRVGEAYVLKPVNDDYTKLSSFVATALAAEAGSSTTTDAAPLEPLKIEILNGTNITGLAGKVAEKIKSTDYVIVRAGNNATRGLTDTVIYDNTGGKKFEQINRLAEILNAKVSTDTVTMPAGVEARVVVGQRAQALTQ